MVQMLATSGTVWEMMALSLAMPASPLDGELATECRDALSFTSSGSPSRYDKIHGIVFDFINQTGLSMIETDGPYGGQTCASVTHTHHQGYSDSVFQQNRLQMQFYTGLKTLNVFINQPDNYFFQGGNKVGMGYSEQQYNLPRWQDLTISRQGMYDDTYYHLPTQGWMFLPLVQYHGGSVCVCVCVCVCV